MVLTEADKRAALEAALNSEALARSEQLRSFLKFVCEMEMEGQANALTEHLIGTRALGRREDYSPLEDSSVRTRAHELRQRLHRYYAVEQPDSSVRIELPKGSYAPKFVTVIAEPQRESPAVETPVRPVEKWAHRGWLFGFLAGVVLSAVAVIAWTSWKSARDQSSPIRQAWSPLVQNGSEVLICMSTPLHLLVSPFMTQTPEESLKYPAPAEVYPLFSRFRPLPKDARLEMQPVQKALMMGNVQGLTRVSALLQSLGTPYQVLPESSSPLAAIKGRNAVIFGSPWYSRAVSVLLEKTPITFALDDESKEIGLVERSPQGVRSFLPKRSARGEYREVYGLISVLPSDSTPDSPHTVIVFSGLTSVGTHAAAAFFTTPANLQSLAERFTKEGLHGWPRSYQVVVHCRASEDTQLLSYEYETHRILAR